MKTRDPFDPGDSAFDKLDEKIRQALMQEGAIIPDGVEQVRKAKARLKKQPVTLPPHLRDSSAIRESSEENGLVKSNEAIVQDQTRPPYHKSGTGSHRTTDEFVEAVAIAHLTRLIASSEFPLGHLRQNKMLYFAHRKAHDEVVGQFLKKAAGPYSPWATYRGPERIAQVSGYVKRAKVGKHFGFVVGENIDKIDRYLSAYPVCVAISWVVENFRYKKNEQLELLATVDFAALDLIAQRKGITKENVRSVIAENPEWKPKLQRDTFSEPSIVRSLSELADLFPETYGGHLAES